MYCPKCGQRQNSAKMRFCSKCGLALDAVTSMLASNFNQYLQDERREIKGISLILAELLMLTNFLIVFGLITLNHLSSTFIWIWVFFMLASFVIGGLGVINLARSGFFKRMRDRELRLRLGEIEQQRQALASELEGRQSDVNHLPPHEPMSIAESTTRELQHMPKARK
jgi:hypothetical protein